MSKKPVIIHLSAKHREWLDLIAESICGTRSSAMRFLLERWFEKKNTTPQQKQ